MLPPSSDVLSNLLSQDPGISCLSIFVCEAVDNIVGLCAHDVNALLFADLSIVSLQHGYRCLEGRWHLVLQIVFPKDISKADRRHFLEKLRLFCLVRQQRLIVDQGGNKELAALSKFTLTISDEGCPVASETGYPLLTLFGLKVLWCC